MVMSKVVLGAKKILRRQRMATLKVITKRVSQHAVDKLKSESCEDGKKMSRVVLRELKVSTYSG